MTELPSNPIEWRVADIPQAIGERRISASEVTAAVLARYEAVNPAVNAVCTINEEAQDEAAAVDRRLGTGAPLRPLEGVPVLIKDNIETAGLRTTFGSKIFADNVPVDDSILVARLRAAGAVILGKTNTPEFAADINTSNFLFGQTRNPWDLNRTSGGSSGGSASAVAAGIAPVGIGTDLGGSIRIPAAFNGLSGLRPSPGRVPVYPQEFAWDTLIAHVQGPLARRVDDLSLLYSVLAGPDERDPTTLPSLPGDYWTLPEDRTSALLGAKVGYLGGLGGLVPIEPEVGGLVRRALAVLQSAGCAVEEASFDASTLRAIIAGTRGYNLIGRLKPHFDAHAEVLTAPITNQVTSAASVDVEMVTNAERLRTAYWHQVRELLERFDFLLTPTAGIPAFRLDKPLPSSVGGAEVTHFYDTVLTTYAFSITGLPALSVPCGFTGTGMPVGLQIIGPRQREDKVLRFGAGFQAIFPEGTARRPRIDTSNVRPVSDAFAPPGVPLTTP